MMFKFKRENFIKRYILSLFCLAFIVSCGHKTDLYIPTPQQLKEQEAREQRIKARNQAIHEDANNHGVSVNADSQGASTFQQTNGSSQ